MNTNNLSLLTDCRQYNLTSSNADVYKNGELKSDIIFNVPRFLKDKQNILYSKISITHAEINYSWYIINEYNNKFDIKVSLVDYFIEIDYGNYNANTFMKALQNKLTALNIDITVSFNTTNGKFILTRASGNFTILSSSTCYNIMGFLKDVQISSNNSVLTCSYPANFIGTKNIFIKIPNIVLENFNSFSKDYVTLQSIPVMTQPFGQIQFINGTNSKFIIGNRSITTLEIQITDDDNNLIDFNNIDWSITLEIETTFQTTLTRESLNKYLE